MNEQGPGDKMTKSNFEAANECEVPDTKEVEQLQKAIHKALNAYADFLDRHSVIYDRTKTDDGDRYKVEKLVAEIDFGSTDRQVGPTFDLIVEWGSSSRCTILTSALR